MKMKIGPSKILRSFFSISIFPFFIIFNENFDMKKTKMKILSFSKIFEIEKNLKFFIENCMKNGKIEIGKKMISHFLMDRFSF